LYTIKKLIFILGHDHVRKLPFLLGLITASSLLDVVGITSIVPFLWMVADPSQFQKIHVVSYIFKMSGLSEWSHFTIFVGFCSLGLLLGSLLLKASSTYRQYLFAFGTLHHISRSLLDGYVQKPYEWYMAQNSGELSKNIISEAGAIMGFGVIPLLTVISQSIIIIAIIILLCFINPIVTLSLIIVAVLLYSLIWLRWGTSLTELGKERSFWSGERFIAINESFGSFKELKLNGLESYFSDQYSLISERYSNLEATVEVRSNLPKFLVEAFAFGGVISVVLVLLSLGQEPEQYIPVLILFAVAGYRLLPAVQSLFSALSKLKFVSEVVSDVYGELKNNDKIELRSTKINAIDFVEQFELRNVCYTYPGSDLNSLSNINISIERNSIVGIIGQSGSGKTTLVDIILGLLPIREGSAWVDGTEIDQANLVNWQAIISYLPQSTFLTDGTVEENITLGQDVLERDAVLLKSVMDMACVSDFVDNLNMEANVGERGGRLSGGQKQRIGLARALYKNSDVLVLDEGTSALDPATENSIIDKLQNLKTTKTIILVTHKLENLRCCDKIYVMKDGQIDGVLTYDELASSKHFVFKAPSKYEELETI
jgi:ATP-binding cassette, subfamily B, bacterial PglK